VSIFATPVVHGTALTRVTPSAPVPNDPALRFAQDPLMWIGLPAGTAIAAFATGGVARAGGAANGIPGDPASAWTAFQLSPLPQMSAAGFKAIRGGLPVQIVLVRGTAGATPAADDCLIAGAPFVTAPAGAGSTAFLGFAFQDRLCRDPLSWAEAIAASGVCDANWAQFVTDLAALPGARHVRVLDHRGAPLTSGTVTVAIDGGPPTAVVLNAGLDGDTGVTVGAAARATVALSGTTAAVVAPGDADEGAFGGSGFQLQPGKRIAQVLDAAAWLAPPDAGVQVQRWNANSFLEPIQEGNPYFARLVQDVRSAKPSGGGPSGAVEMAGWAFVRGSQTDSSVDWPLVPGDASTTLVNLITELHGAGVDVRLLLNQFLRFDSASLDDFPELVPILFAFYAGLAPLQVLASVNTDPAGYVIGLLAVAALTTVLTSSVTFDLIKSVAEFSKPLKEALDLLDPALATWTPYPAAFADNPLVPSPPKILGHTIDDFSHLGVFHQKFVNVRTAAGEHLSYLGGIDINNDRPDTSLHRAHHPFHDVQVRITGPAVADVIRTYAERAGLFGASVPIAAPGPLAGTGSHLVQIARTYFAPQAGSPTPPLSFAPGGETTPVRSIENAIAQARDYIYIEDQYFTPPDDYVQALLDAGDPARNVRALIVTMPYSTDQPYGGIRRADVLAALQARWGARFHTGTPLRRFLHETPALTTNLGRLRLASALSAGSAMAVIAPPVHLPPPPFWAFIGNELVLVHAIAAPVSGSGESTTQQIEIVRASGGPGWGARPIAHPAGTPLLAVQVPGIYVHAKVMMVDDTFLFAGSSNINRRGLYHDGEMNSFTIPQHLRGDPKNPARILRSRLFAEHLGLSPEMGLALFADAPAALPYFAARTWYEGSKVVPLSFFGSVPLDVPIGTGSSIPSFLLQVLIGALHDAAKPDVWPMLADPTTTLQPVPRVKGPNFP
jgi:phosphatidylserine/phosphatidylglycerophosphate/cardiolipin synthase-like enzyme